jgi:hypothetical protein
MGLVFLGRFGELPHEPVEKTRECVGDHEQTEAGSAQGSIGFSTNSNMRVSFTRRIPSWLSFWAVTKRWPSR